METGKRTLFIAILFAVTIGLSNTHILTKSAEDSKIGGSNSEQVRKDEEPIIRTCGGVIEGESGVIEYSPNGTYAGYLRCIWTIRTSPPTRQIELTKELSGFELGYDYLTVFSFVARTGAYSMEVIGKESNDEVTVVMTGSVAIVQFSSDPSSSRFGFRLRFRAVGSPESLAVRDFNTGDSPTALSHFSDTEPYENNQLSTFVFSNNYRSNGGSYTLTIPYYSIENSSGCTYDGLIVYKIDVESIRQMGL